MPETPSRLPTAEELESILWTDSDLDVAAIKSLARSHAPQPTDEFLIGEFACDLHDLIRDMEAEGRTRRQIAGRVLRELEDESPTCPLCVEPVRPSDDAVAINDETRGAHRECVVRAVAGSVGHQQGKCECHGVPDDSEDGLTRRQAALAAFVYFRDHQPGWHDPNCDAGAVRVPPQEPPAIAVGDVVQIDPDHDPCFGGSFMVVTEVKGWGAIGYVTIPHDGRRGPAYYRCPTGKFKRIGRAEWLLE